MAGYASLGSSTVKSLLTAVCHRANKLWDDSGGRDALAAAGPVHGHAGRAPQHGAGVRPAHLAPAPSPSHLHPCPPLALEPRRCPCPGTLLDPMPCAMSWCLDGEHCGMCQDRMLIHMAMQVRDLVDTLHA